MTSLPTVSPSGDSRFVRHCGTAVFVRSAQDHEGPRESLGARPSIVVANAMVERLFGLGIRVVIAPGFEPRFFSEAIRQGILLVTLSHETIDAIGAWIDATPHETITVDLENQTIEAQGLASVSFDTTPRVRRRLLYGLEDFDELLQHRDAAATFRLADSKRRPWLYAN